MSFTDYFSSFLGATTPAAVISLLALLFDTLPGVKRKWATNILSHADFSMLLRNSNMHNYIQKVDDMSEKIDAMSKGIAENQRDTIKNTIIHLLDQPTNQSDKVAYELGKLQRLDAQCWVIPVAEKYLENPNQYIMEHAKNVYQLRKEAKNES